MALSKLAIGLIATIGSIATISRLTAAVVITRQNTNQTIQDTNEFKEPKVETNNKNQSNEIDSNSLNSDSLKESEIENRPLIDDASTVDESRSQQG